MSLDTSFFLSERRRRELAKRPQATLVAAFAAAILVGAGLLMLPAANRDGEWLPIQRALATATSATCVTGLVAEPLSSFTVFGRLVAMSLIQLGGLGVMTLGTILVAATGRRISMRDESITMSSFATDHTRSARAILARVSACTFTAEAAGAVFLSIRLAQCGAPPKLAVAEGIFHSISAFCNAGFAIGGTCLTDVPCKVAILSLAMLGGLGFPVIDNLVSMAGHRMRGRAARLRHPHAPGARLSLHSRVSLFATLVLLLAGWLAFTAIEWNSMFQGMTPAGKIASGLALAANPRSSGFGFVDAADMAPESQVLTMVLMLVGGSPRSTAGGMKTTTIAVLLLTIYAMARGRSRTELRHRTIPESSVREAIVIVVASFVFIGAMFCGLMATEHATAGDMFPLLFESVSAYSTAGIEMGTAHVLSEAGKMLVVLAMFAGRIGPLALALTVGRGAAAPLLSYPEEDVAVG